MQVEGENLSSKNSSGSVFEASMTKDFWFNVERIFGYLYSGLSALLVASIVEPESIRAVINTLGTGLSILISTGLGIALYSIYYRVIGEIFLFQAQRFIHFLYDLVLFKKQENQTSTTGFLGFLGVPFGHRRLAYEFVKDRVISHDQQKEIKLSHGELHILYISSVFSFSGYFYIFYYGSGGRLFLFSGLLFFLCAIFGDIIQHIKESRMFKNLPREVLIENLRKEGLI